VNTVASIDLYYRTSGLSNLGGLALHSISNSSPLPANFSTSYVSGNIQITNCNVTNTSNNFLLMPNAGMIMYASYQGVPTPSNVTQWYSNQTWALQQLPVGRLTIQSNYIQLVAPFTSQGVAGPGYLDSPGDGQLYKLANITLTFNRNICI
jgi:hypothetical protein